MYILNFINSECLTLYRSIPSRQMLNILSQFRIIKLGFNDGIDISVRVEEKIQILMNVHVVRIEKK